MHHLVRASTAALLREPRPYPWTAMAFFLNRWSSSEAYLELSHFCSASLSVCPLWGRGSGDCYGVSGERVLISGYRLGTRVASEDGL